MKDFLTRVSASKPGTGHTVSCGKAPAVCAWEKLALGPCSAGPWVNNLLNFADSTAFHQDKIKVIFLKSWCQQKEAQGMNGRRPGAPRLPGARCMPLPFPPRLQLVKAPSLSSRAGNRCSCSHLLLLPKQLHSVACLRHGLRLPLLREPCRGCSRAQHARLALGTEAASAKGCSQNVFL